MRGHDEQEGRPYDLVLAVHGYMGLGASNVVVNISKARTICGTAPFVVRTP